MKKLFSSCFSFLLFVSAFAQNWQAVGPDDSKQISFSHASNEFLFSNAAGDRFIVYSDSVSYVNANAHYYRFLLKKETSSGWMLVTKITMQIHYSLFSFAMNSVGELYLARDTTVSGMPAIRTMKFDGTSWSDVGAPYVLSTLYTVWPKIKLDPNDNPYIFYCRLNTGDFPYMIRWDGTSWVNVGNAIDNTLLSPAQVDFDFKSDGTPYVAYPDALFSDSLVVKKFDGANWLQVGQSRVTGSYGSASLIMRNDTPVIASSTGNFTRFKKFDGNNWADMTTLNYALHANMQMDANYNIYFAAGNGSSDFIYKMIGSTATIIGPSAFSSAAIFNVTKAGSVYASIIDNNYLNKIRIKQWNGADWLEPYPVSIYPFYGGEVHRFAIDKYDSLYLMKMNATNNGGGVLKFSNGKWNKLGVSIFATATPFTSRFDTSNVLNLIFPVLSGTSTNLRVQRLVGTNWTALGVPTSSYAYGSMVIDKNNTVYVAYIDMTAFGASRLRVKKYDGTAWADVSISTPFVSSNPAANPLLTCDTFNNISVLYKEPSGLIVKKFDGTAWNNVGGIIDTTGSIDYSITCTSAGDPIVAYLNAASGVRKPTLKKFDGTSWVTLGNSQFSYGLASQLSLATLNDTVYLAYLDKTLKDIVVARYDGTNLGSLGQIAYDTCSYPNIVTSGHDVYLSYYSGGFFVKKLTGNIIFPFASCPIPVVTTNSVTATTADIGWTATSANNYQYGISTINTLPSNPTTTTNNAYQATNLLPNTTYYFSVRGICTLDTSSWNTVSFTTDIVNNITEQNNNYITSVYPNPVRDKLTIESNFIIQAIIIYDVYGRKLMVLYPNKMKVGIDMSSFSIGNYFIKCVVDDRIDVIEVFKE